jgi:hypothetical protein
MSETRPGEEERELESVAALSLEAFGNRELVDFCP